VVETRKLVAILAADVVGYSRLAGSDEDRTLALSPRDPTGGAWHTILGASEICLGRLDAAVGEIKRGINVGYRTYFPYAFLAGAEAARGNDAEAKSALAEARRLNSQLTIKVFSETMPALPIVVDGLRKAGLPEE